MSLKHSKNFFYRGKLSGVDYLEQTLTQIDAKFCVKNWFFLTFVSMRQVENGKLLTYAMELKVSAGPAPLLEKTVVRRKSVRTSSDS